MAAACVRFNRRGLVASQPQDMTDVEMGPLYAGDVFCHRSQSVMGGQTDQSSQSVSVAQSCKVEGRGKATSQSVSFAHVWKNTWCPLCPARPATPASCRTIVRHSQKKISRIVLWGWRSLQALNPSPKVGTRYFHFPYFSYGGGCGERQPPAPFPMFLGHSSTSK